MRLVATVPLNTPRELRALAEDVFGAVARARFVSVGSLMAYGGPDGLSLEVLDAWCRAGLLHRGRVQPDPLRPEEIEYVALTTVGARALHAATGRCVEGTTAARLKRSSQKRMHDVLVGEVALAVLALAKDGRIEIVGVETDDRKLAHAVHIAEPGQEPERIVLQPDGLVVTKGPMGHEALLVEVDRSTTAPKRMQLRYKGYLAWQKARGPVSDFGIGALRVLTLVPTNARLETLHAAALEANQGRRSGFLIFGLLDDVTVCAAERLLKLVARPLGGEPGQRVRLISPAVPSAAA
jgi:hypothetical protein